MKDFIFELCAESLESARAGEAGGANRIELCAGLPVGGVTPDLLLVVATIQALTIPVFVMIRPRGGDFVCSREEFDLMRRQIVEVKHAGAAGVVLGVLHADGRVDAERTRILVELARPMKVTFHRAFDCVPDQSEALETVIATGVDYLLTSGGELDVMAGATEISQLREQAVERLTVMAGGGLKLSNLVEVVRRTGVYSLHGSLLSNRVAGGVAAPAAVQDPHTLEADVREAIRLLRMELEVLETEAKMLR